MTERGPTTKSVDEDLGELTQEVKELARSVNGLRTDYAVVERDLKFIRWIGVFFTGTLVAVVLGSGHVVWDAATITTEVKQQREDMKELKSEVKQQGADTRDLKFEVKQQGADMRDLKSEVKQQGARLDKIEGRLDGMSRQLDVLIRRTDPGRGDPAKGKGE